MAATDLSLPIHEIDTFRGWTVLYDPAVVDDDVRLTVVAACAS